MRRTLAHFTVVMILGGLASLYPSAGCTPDADPTKEHLGDAQQALPDGCPIGSDAQMPKPTGWCLYSYEGTAATGQNANGAPFTLVCVDDATLRCNMSCSCRSDQLVEAFDGCQAGAAVASAGCSTWAPTRTVTDTKTITLPPGTAKCGDRSGGDSLNLCSQAWAGASPSPAGLDSWSVNAASCDKLCRLRLVEGVFLQSAPELCCIPQQPPPGVSGVVSPSGGGGSGGAESWGGGGGSGGAGSSSGGGGSGGNGAGAVGLGAASASPG